LLNKDKEQLETNTVQLNTSDNGNKKASIHWQDSAPPISGCLSCNNR